jgi:hypothetical protein
MTMMLLPMLQRWSTKNDKLRLNDKKAIKMGEMETEARRFERRHSTAMRTL